MHRLVHATLAIAACLLIGGCPDPADTSGMNSGGGTGGAGSGGSGGSTGGSATIGSTDADRILTLVNTERTSRGLGVLTRNDLLDETARGHAGDMAVGGFFSHTGSDGSSVSDRATAAGYAWTLIGENIGQGDVSPEAMMDLWMNSDGHRANILNPGFTKLGVGIDDSGVTLWVQVFGTP